MHKTSAQFAKFITVGCLNTLVTFVVIFVCKSLLGVNPFVSNAIGYVAGVINSFVWNKMWVFKSKGAPTREALSFLIGFGLCYGIQLLFVWGTTTLTPLGHMEWQIWKFTLGGYGVATIIGMAIYTVCNFIYNRAIAFRHR